MKTVLFRGPVLTQSGYGVHSRQLARWLLQRPNTDVKFSVLPWGDTPFLIDGSLHGGLVGEVMKRSVAPDTKADATVQLQLPDEWTVDLAPVNVGITAGVETDRCNPAWVDACNRMTKVIVPSRHAQQCLANSGPLLQPITVIPEAYSDALAEPPVSLNVDFDTPFNFLVFGQLTGNNPESDRKNIFYTIKWLSEALKDDPDVGIVVKTNAGKNSRIDRTMTKNLLMGVANESRRGNKFPRTYLLHGDMSDGDVAALYRHPKIKALVALTRGEGYGLPILEAAAAGLPVIATGWSGHTDFLSRGKYVSIHYQLADVHPSRIDNRIFVKGARWAHVSEEDAKKRLLKFRQSPATPKQWATDLAKVLQRNYSLQAIFQQYDAALAGVL